MNLSMFNLCSNEIVGERFMMFKLHISFFNVFFLPRLVPPEVMDVLAFLGGF